MQPENKIILYLDDCADDRFIFKTELKGKPHVLHMIESIKCISDLPNIDFGLIVIDVNLDGESGYEAYSILKNKFNSALFVITSGLFECIDMNFYENCEMITKDNLIKSVGHWLEYGSTN